MSDIDWKARALDAEAKLEKIRAQLTEPTLKTIYRFEVSHGGIK